MSRRIFSRCAVCRQTLPFKIKGGRKTAEQRQACPAHKDRAPVWLVVENSGYEAGERKRSTRTFTTRIEAERYRATRDAAEAGLAVLVEPSVEPFSNVLARWVASRTSLAPNTKSAYERVTKLVENDRLGIRPIGQITKADLRGLYARWFATYSVASVRQFSSVIAGCISEAHAEGHIRTNPSFKALEIPKDIVPAKQQRKSWTADQAHTFIADAHDDELYVLWRLLLATGMRRSEALALEREDFDLEERSVEIHGSLVSVKRSGEIIVGRPKSGKTRTAYFDEDTADLIASHLHDLRLERMRAQYWLDGYEFAFQRGSGLPWNPSTVSMRFKTLIDKLGLLAIGVHGLRHSAATLLIENGVDVTAVRDHLGHASIDTTVGSYSHRSAESRQNVANALGRIVNGGG